jgi:hypothetical protein
MQQTDEVISEIAKWRLKQKEGTMSLDDWIASFKYLRANRMGAQAASAASKARTAKAPVDLSALKDSLKALKKT